jgi:precorrin-3B synthase
MSAIAPRHEGSRPVAPRRKGWCPGALRPMEAGDGLLARVRAPRGRLSLDQAAALADAAIACGNGAIGLSARGNLHLRGSSERTLSDLHARLSDAGLIDADPEIERLRNIVASPLDDVDPEALLDLSSSVAALETRLAGDEGLRRLPAKFSFVLDARGRLPLADVDADIRFEAVGDGTLAVFLTGEDALAAQCAPSETGEVAARLGRAFVRLAGAGEGAPRRMRALVGRRGAMAVFGEAGLETRPGERSQRRASFSDVLGVHEYGAEVVVGAAAAFGEITGAPFRALIERARALGANGLRLTPWRAFLIAGLDVSSADAMLGSVAKLGFIASADEPRLRIAACPGAPACMHGLRPAREDAARFALLLPKGEGVILHVSGCAKGCARPVATAATLTATGAGYDLILAGRASDPPARRGLSTASIEGLLVSEGARMFAGEGRRP